MDRFEAKEKYFMDKLCRKEKMHFGDCCDCCDCEPEVVCEEGPPIPWCTESRIITPPPINNHTRNDIRKNNNNGNKTISNCGGNVNFYTKTGSSEQPGIPVNVTLGNNTGTTPTTPSAASGAVPFDPAAAPSYQAGTLVTYNCEVYMVNRSNPCGVPGQSSDYTKLSNNNQNGSNNCCNPCGGMTFGFPTSGYTEECCLTTCDNCTSVNTNGMFIEGFDPSRANCYVAGQIISYNGNLYQVNRNSPRGIPGCSSDYTKLTNNKNCRNRVSNNVGSISGYFFNNKDINESVAVDDEVPLREASPNNTKGFFRLSGSNVHILRSGIYRVQYSALLNSNSATTVFALYNNEILIRGSQAGAVSGTISGNALMKLKRGDIVSIRNIGQDTTLKGKIAGKNPIVASLYLEKVAKKYEN